MSTSAGPPVAPASAPRTLGFRLVSAGPNEGHVDTVPQSGGGARNGRAGTS